jgi:hypothetical protein
VAALAAACALLYGRYDGSQIPYARNAFVSSAYFLLLAVPIAYHVVWALAKRRTWARVAAGVVTAVWAMPLHWLKLDRFRALGSIAYWNTQKNVWPPPLAEGAPGERLLLVGLVVVFAVIAFAVARRRAAPLVGLLALITLQTALHTSLRSPYTYTAHFERHDKWYHLFQVPPDRGALNADAIFFTTLDDHFNGVPRPVRTLLIRRSFVHWLASPFSYFWNPYYVYLVVNDLLWLLAAVCTWFWARRIGASSTAAQVAAALVACGNGFVYFVAQPMSYLASYAIVAVAIASYELLVVEGGGWLLWGGVFGLCAATYDLFPMMPAFVLYAWARGAPIRKTVAALVVSLAVPLGFVAVEHRVLGLVLDDSNARKGTAALGGIVRLLRHGTPIRWMQELAGYAVVLATDLLHAFFIAGFLVGAAGFVVADRVHKRLLAIWVLPSVLLVAYLYFGGERWGHLLLAQLPRLSYICYPSVYLAAALLLARLRPSLRWAAVAALFVLVNLDVFGVPDLHYHFYWPTPLECDPYAGAACSDLPFR